MPDDLVRHSFEFSAGDVGGIAYDQIDRAVKLIGIEWCHEIAVAKFHPISKLQEFAVAPAQSDGVGGKIRSPDPGSWRISCECQRQIARPGTHIDNDRALLCLQDVLEAGQRRMPQQRRFFTRYQGLCRSDQLDAHELLAPGQMSEGGTFDPPPNQLAQAGDCRFIELGKTRFAGPLGTKWRAMSGMPKCGKGGRDVFLGLVGQGPQTLFQFLFAATVELAQIFGDRSCAPKA